MPVNMANGIVEWYYQPFTDTGRVVLSVPSGTGIFKLEHVSFGRLVKVEESTDSGRSHEYFIETHLIELIRENIVPRLWQFYAHGLCSDCYCLHVTVKWEYEMKGFSKVNAKVLQSD